MITNTDITKLKEVLATKEELADVKVELGEVHEKIDTVAAAVGRMENTLDTIAGAVHDLRTENGAGAAHLARHDRQIEALARGTGIHITN